MLAYACLHTPEFQVIGVIERCMQFMHPEHLQNEQNTVCTISCHDLGAKKECSISMRAQSLF